MSKLWDLTILYKTRKYIRQYLLSRVLEISLVSQEAHWTPVRHQVPCKLFSQVFMHRTCVASPRKNIFSSSRKKRMRLNQRINKQLLQGHKYSKQLKRDLNPVLPNFKTYYLRICLWLTGFSSENSTSTGQKPELCCQKPLTNEKWHHSFPSSFNRPCNVPTDV